MTDHDTWVVTRGGSAAKEVGVICDDHTILLLGKLKLGLVTGRTQPGFDCGCDIDAVTPQRSGNIGVDVFVEVKANPFSHQS